MMGDRDWHRNTSIIIRWTLETATRHLRCTLETATRHLRCTLETATRHLIVAAVMYGVRCAAAIWRVSNYMPADCRHLKLPPDARGENKSAEAIEIPHYHNQWPSHNRQCSRAEKGSWSEVDWDWTVLD